MIQLNIARFAKLDRWLAWELKSGGIFVRFPEQQMSLHTLFFVHRNILFKHMFSGMNIIESGVTYPPGITRQSNVYEFLMNDSSPLSIEVPLRNGEKKYLRNRACDETVKIIKKQIQNPGSIYKRLQAYMGENAEFNSIYSPKINFFLNQFYLRLTGMTHCKLKNIPLSSKISQSLASNILNHIGEQYENHSPAAIKRVQRQKELIVQKISLTQKEINTIVSESERKVILYKYGVMFVTFAHMVSFGYMIFFVDWLGWDIIEPLTYSVGVFYTLLGIRFYRKYKTDRTLTNINEILQKIVMKPARLVHLRELKIIQEMQKQQLRRIQTKLALLNNRVNFRTSLVDSFSHYSKEQK